jgi:hypothetical protein
LVADSTQVPFDLHNLSDEERKSIWHLLLPEHLDIIRSMADQGVNNLLLKNFVNNSSEVSNLQELQRQNPELRLYARFYTQNVHHYLF